MLRKLAVPVLTAALCWQCGESPTQPTLSGIVPPATSAPLDLQAGVYQMAVSGVDFSWSAAALEAVCAPAAVPPAGKTVEAQMVFTREGDGWVGRSTSGADAFELRIRDAGYRQAGRRHVVGSARGRLTDRSGRSVVVTVGDETAEATLSGEADNVLRSVFAELTGTLSFSDAQGRTASCTRVSVTVGPPR